MKQHGVEVLSGLKATMNMLPGFDPARGHYVFPHFLFFSCVVIHNDIPLIL